MLLETNGVYDTHTPKHPNKLNVKTQNMNNDADGHLRVFNIWFLYVANLIHKIFPPEQLTLHGGRWPIWLSFQFKTIGSQLNCLPRYLGSKLRINAI